MSYCASVLPASSRAATVVRPGPTPNMKTLFLLAGRTSMTFGSAAKRLETVPLMWNTRPAPASRTTEPGEVVAATGERAAAFHPRVPPERRQSERLGRAPGRRPRPGDQRGGPGRLLPLEFHLFDVLATVHPDRASGFVLVAE